MECPGILIAPTWAGRDQFCCDQAVKLAQKGYAAMAIDIYGEAKVGSNRKECSAYVQPFLEDRELLLEHLQAAVETIKKQPEVDPKKIAAIGFCFGGLAVLDMARANMDLAGVVSLHGILTAPNDVYSILIFIYGILSVILWRKPCHK